MINDRLVVLENNLEDAQPLNVALDGSNSIMSIQVPCTKEQLSIHDLSVGSLEIRNGDEVFYLDVFSTKQYDESIEMFLEMDNDVYPENDTCKLTTDVFKDINTRLVLNINTEDENVRLETLKYTFYVMLHDSDKTLLEVEINALDLI